MRSCLIVCVALCYVTFVTALSGTVDVNELLERSVKSQGPWTVPIFVESESEAEQHTSSSAALQAWMKEQERAAIVSEQSAKEALAKAQLQQKKLLLESQAEDAKKANDRARSLDREARERLREARKEQIHAVEQQTHVALQERKGKEHSIKARAKLRSQLALKLLNRYGKNFALLFKNETDFFLRKFPLKFSQLKQNISLMQAHHMRQAKNGSSYVLCPQSFNGQVRQEATLTSWLSAVVHSSSFYGAGIPMENQPLPLPVALPEFFNVAQTLNLSVVRGIHTASPDYAFQNYRAPYYLVRSEPLNTIFVAFVPYDNAAPRLYDWTRAGGFKYSWAKLDVDGFYYGHVHKGYLNLWGRSGPSVLNELRDELNQNTTTGQKPRVVFSGFGEAGAMAQLFALECALRLNITPGVYTFGAPRIGNRHFASWIEHRTEHYRFVFHNDMFPTIPIYRYHYPPIHRRHRHHHRRNRFLTIPHAHEAFFHGDRVGIRLMPSYDANGRTVFNCFDESIPDQQVSNQDHHALRYALALMNIGSSLLPQGVPHYDFCYPANVSAASFPPQIQPFLPPSFKNLKACPNNLTIPCLPKRIRRLFRPEFSALLPAALMSLPPCPGYTNVVIPPRPFVTAQDMTNQNGSSFVPPMNSKSPAYTYNPSMAAQRTPEQEKRSKAEWNNKNPEEQRKRQRNQEEHRRKYVRTLQERDRKSDRSIERKKEHDEWNLQMQTMQQQYHQTIQSLQAEHSADEGHAERQSQLESLLHQPQQDPAIQPHFTEKLPQGAPSQPQPITQDPLQRTAQMKAAPVLVKPKVNSFREEETTRNRLKEETRKAKLQADNAQEELQKSETKLQRVRALNEARQEATSGTNTKDFDVLYAPCLPSGMTRFSLPQEILALPFIHDLGNCPDFTKPCLPAGSVFPHDLRSKVPHSLASLPTCPS